MLQRKLFLGARLKRLRRDRGLNQSQMADQLGISASYLNHLERNQRPVTAGILLRLAEGFDVDVKTFASESADGGGATQLAEIFSDPMLADLGISRSELVELADNTPTVAEGIARPLHRCPRHAAAAFRRGTPRRSASADHAGNLGARLYTVAAQPLARTGGGVRDPGRRAQPSAFRRRTAPAAAEGSWGVEVRVVGPEQLEGASQVYDPQRRVLTLSSLLRPENRQFGLAYQMALLEFAPIISRMLEAARPPDPGRRLLHMSFANYAAGAIIMPYGKFLRAAEEHRYAIDRLCAHFASNVEQVAHRLTTMSRSGSRASPSSCSASIPPGTSPSATPANSFSHFGGTCPRWHLHAAFQTPGRRSGSSRLPTASASSRSAEPSSVPSGPTSATTHSWRSGWVAT